MPPRRPGACARRYPPPPRHNRPVRLPERLEGDGLVLRRWLLADAERLHAAIARNVSHLRPWLAWAALEPQPLERHRALLLGWERAWEAGGEAMYGMFVDGAVAGSCGLMPRVGPAALEIGYWVDAEHLRRGVATRAARLLAAAAFSQPGTDAVEIHHDRANTASEGVPRALGFALVAERECERHGDADEGVDLIWRLGRAQWLRRSGT